MGTYDTRGGSPISPDANDDVTELEEKILVLLEEAGIDTQTNDAIMKLVRIGEIRLAGTIS